MSWDIERRLDSLYDHFAALCVFLALFTLTWIGVGDVRTISMLGLLLCAVGAVQRSAQADLRILLPMAVYELASMASTFAAYGNITEGYAIIQLVLPVLCLLIACLDQNGLRLLKRLCLLWAGTAALISTGQFVWRAAALGSTGRLSGVLGNPNAMGIFLVIGWFLLLHCTAQPDCPRFLLHLEPLLLIALALTLSMGSFAAMAVGILVLLAGQKRLCTWNEVFLFACRLLAKTVLGVGTGVLLYLGAARTGVAWICPVIALYGGAAVLCWGEFDRFLAACPKIAAAITAMGFVVAGTVILIRPSSAATFAERLEMMKSGMQYLCVNPLLGVGPFRWRLLDLYDGGTYFNTWHIHNALLHVGVEFGWIAMAMLAAIVVRAFQKQPDGAAKAGLTAFCVHNMMDTSFFYVGISALALTAAACPACGGRSIPQKILRGLFGVCAALFAWGLCCSITAG